MAIDLLRDIRALAPTLGLEPWEAAQLAPVKPIMVGYRGSHAHGMYVAPTEPTGIDDVDLLSVFVPGLHFYLGNQNHARTVEKWVRHYDTVSYELRHFVALLVNCNPNVVSMLWLPDEHYLFLSETGQMLRDSRRLFSTKRAYNSFFGYARGQFKRMRAELDGERYKTGHLGEKRKALVLKFGYDVKNAAHCMRLLHMGVEFLRTGEAIVDRRKAGDADMLLAIKRGEWTLEQIEVEVGKQFGFLAEAYANCKLPDEPDDNKVNELVLDILCAEIAGDAIRHHVWRLQGKPTIYGGSSNVLDEIVGEPKESAFVHKV